MLKKLLFGFFSLALSVLSVNGQNKVSFVYDSSGNRMKREIILTASVVSHGSSIENAGLSTDFFEDEQARIYPDPIQSKLTVEAKYPDKKANASLSVYDHSGEEVLTKNTALTSTDIDMSNLIAGIYFLDIKMNGNSAVWKIIKQ